MMTSPDIKSVDVEIRMNKLLILDKSVFHKSLLEKKAKDKLLRFVKCHNVILPHALCVECAVSQKGNSTKEDKDPIMLMNTFHEIVKNGAYAGKSPSRIVKEERSLNTAIESLIDEEQTEIMREAILKEKPDTEKAGSMCEEAFKPITETVKQWTKQFYQSILEKNKERDFREEVDECCLVIRLKKWLQVADEKKSDILDKYYASGRRYVFEDGWEWQMLRLSLAWGTELASKRNKSGPGFDIENYSISNDIYDIFYVSHLLHADGLITNDKELQRPLAMAAFPDKDVFQSIEDVPCRYCTGKKELIESIQE